MTRAIGLVLAAPLAGFALEALLGAGRFELHLRSWGYTLIVAGGAALLALVLGVPVGVVLSQSRRTLPRILSLIPLLLPPVLGAAAWMGLGLPLPGALGCAIILGSLTWPVVAFLLDASLRRIPSDALDAARIQLRPGRLLDVVIWPAIRPSLGAAALLVFLLAASEFTVPALFVVPTVSMTLYEELSAFRTASAAATALPLVALALALAWGLRRLPFIPPSRPGRAVPGGPLLAAAWAASVLTWGATTLAPAAIFAWRAGPFWRIDPMHLESVAWSAAVGSLVAGGLTGWASLRPGRSRLEPVWLAMLVLPGVVAGLGTLELARRTGILPWLGPSGALLVLALMGRFAFAAWLPLREPVDPGQLEAAELSGLSAFRVWRRILLPALLPRAVAVAAIVFVLAIGEIGPVVLLSPPGRLTAAQHLFNLLHYGYDDVVASIALFLFVATGLITWSCMNVGRLRTDRIPH